MTCVTNIGPEPKTGLFCILFRRIPKYNGFIFRGGRYKTIDCLYLLCLIEKDRAKMVIIYKAIEGQFDVYVDTTDASRALGVSPSTLKRKLAKHHGIFSGGDGTLVSDNVTIHKSGRGRR